MNTLNGVKERQKELDDYVNAILDLLENLGIKSANHEAMENYLVVTSSDDGYVYEFIARNSRFVTNGSFVSWMLKKGLVDGRT